MKNLLFTLILFALLSSCVDNSSITIVKSFPIHKDLKSEIVSIPSDVVLYAFNLFVTNDKLITFNSDKEYIFDVYQLPDLQYLYSGGTQGNGPTDFMNVARKTFIPTDKGFKVFIEGHKKLKEVLVGEECMNINQENIVTLKDIEVDLVNGFLSLNDSTSLYWSGFDAETEYTLFNHNDKNATTFSPYPDWDGGSIMGNKIFTYVKNSVKNHDGTKFASFYGYFKKIRIYDNTGNLLNDIAVEVPPYSDDIEELTQDRIQYYYGYPHATKDYIYALCRNDKPNTNETSTELQVWNWKGEPVAQYNLDKRISLFTISEKYKKIYGVNADDEKIYVYPLLH